MPSDLGSRYMLKKWFSGRECDVKKEFEILQASRNLADLHCRMQWQELCDPEKEAVIRPPTGRHLQEEFVRHNRELKMCIRDRYFMRIQCYNSTSV